MELVILEENCEICGRSMIVIVNDSKKILETSKKIYCLECSEIIQLNFYVQLNLYEISPKEKIIDDLYDLYVENKSSMI